jgi:Lon protease-like protein
VPLIPLFPLELVLFPGAPLPLHIFEPRYKEMIAECLEHDRPFGMVRAKDNSLSAIGCSASILNVLKKYEDGRLDIAAEGLQRFEIKEVNQERSFLQAEVTYFEDEPSMPGESELDSVVQLHDLDFKQTLLEMKSEVERIETLIEYYRATIPKVEKTLLARQRASGNGHVH